MRRFVLLLFTVFLSFTAFAQLEVKKGSFKEVPGFVNVNHDENYQFDDNNLPFAVIKVRTENISDKQRRELRFDSNMAVGIILEYHTGEVWVYLTAKYADYLKISHPDFSSIEFTIPFDLQPKKGYEMTLVNKSVPIGSVNEIYNVLIISTDQDDAMIYIDNEFVGKHEVIKPLKAGEKHIWRIECGLFYTESGESVIPSKEGENVTVSKTLRPCFGYLNVTSAPESGAEVFIDGKKVGQTPYKSEKLSVGDHQVMVKKEMFFAAEKTFTVIDKNTTQASMTMTANFVNVTVTTDSESDIYVDNEYKGKGSWSGRLSDGTHSLEARKVSHRPSKKNVQLVLGKNESVVIPNPEPIYGTVEVASIPTGASIIIDGNDYGTTPKILDNVLIGTHKLRLEKNGCAPVTKTITLDETGKLTINEELLTDREISIYTDGIGDKIFVDGNYSGESPLTVVLSFGEHEIKAVRDGKEISKIINVTQTTGDVSVLLGFYENKTFTVNGVSFEMVAVKGGTFTMGCTKKLSFNHNGDENPTHNVTLSDYYIGKFEVTVDLFRAFVNETNYRTDADRAERKSSYWNGASWKEKWGVNWKCDARGDVRNDSEGNHPVLFVSWNDAKAFCEWLSRKTGQNFRLPTEAEWEYAARGGSKSRGYTYSGSNSIGKVAWRYIVLINDLILGSTHQVGTKAPNELGIYDMSGNVREWCQDFYGLYSSKSQNNPTGPSSGIYPVSRGGSWNDKAKGCRISARYHDLPDYRNSYLGFRLVADK